MTEPYKILCEARELLSKSHDLIASASDHNGWHNSRLVGVCPAIEELIEQLHDACEVCEIINNMESAHDQIR